MDFLSYHLVDGPHSTFHGTSHNLTTHHEPPVLDYREYEEGGHMYDSLHRHPNSALGPEKWYEHTDLDIEFDLLSTYVTWIAARLSEAVENGNAGSERFYEELFKVVKGDYWDAKRALDENISKQAEDIREDEPESEPGIEIGTSRSWDRERKQWRAYVRRYIRIPDRVRKTVTTYGNVEGTGPPTQIEYLDDRPEYVAFMRTHGIYNPNHERLCRELGLPGVWDDMCAEAEDKRREAGTQREEGRAAIIRALLESSEYKESRDRLVTEWNDHPPPNIQWNHGDNPSFVSKQRMNCRQLVSELFETRAFKEALARSIAERRCSLSIDPLSSSGDEHPRVCKKGAHDDVNEDVEKWGPAFCFT